MEEGFRRLGEVVRGDSGRSGMPPSGSHLNVEPHTSCVWYDGQKPLHLTQHGSLPWHRNTFISKRGYTYVGDGDVGGGVTDEGGSRAAGARRDSGAGDTLDQEVEGVVAAFHVDVVVGHGEGQGRGRPHPGRDGKGGRDGDH